MLLDELWRNGWTLVDVHKAAAGTVRVPEGRKPLVLYEDDANYYRYFRGEGLARRLVLDPDGEVRAELPGGALSTADVVPLVDAMVARHPEFSAEGAKGVLALTGFEGLLGERDPECPLRTAASPGSPTGSAPTAGPSRATPTATSTSRPHRSTTIREDTAQVALPGWPVGTGRRPRLSVRRPARRRPRSGRWWTSASRSRSTSTSGPRRRHVGGAIVMSRRHVDGLAFDAPARQRAVLRRRSGPGSPPPLTCRP